MTESCVSFGVWDFYIAIIFLEVGCFFMIHVALVAGTLLTHDEDCGLKHCLLNISEWETCFQLTTQLCMLMNVILGKDYTREFCQYYKRTIVLSCLHIINKVVKARLPGHFTIRRHT